MDAEFACMRKRNALPREGRTRDPDPGHVPVHGGRRLRTVAARGRGPVHGRGPPPGPLCDATAARKRPTGAPSRAARPLRETSPSRLLQKAESLTTTSTLAVQKHHRSRLPNLLARVPPSVKALFLSFPSHIVFNFLPYCQQFLALL